MIAPAHGDEVRAEKGTVIFRQGDPGDDMFVISEGRVRLTLGSGSDAKEVAVLGKGEFFGELSLLTGAARTATAEAIEDSRLLAIGRDAFAMLVQDDLDVVFRMMSTQGRRLMQTNEPVQRLAEKLGQIRIAVHCLRRLGAAMRLPCTVEVEGLAAALQIDAEAVSATLADLARSGAGTIEDGRWHIERPEQVDRLIEVLCRYSSAL